MTFMFNFSQVEVLFSMCFLLVFLSLGGLLYISQDSPSSLSHIRFDDIK